MDKITTAHRRMHPSKSHDDRHAIEDAARSPDTVVRDVPAIVGANLRRLRKAQGHSLERLAELSGVSRAMLGQIETGKSVPTVSLLWKVADALGVPVASLIETDAAPAVVVLVRDQGEVVARSGGKFIRRPLFHAGRPHGSEFYEVRIAAHHRESPDVHPHGTKQSLVVALGTVTVFIADEAPIKLGEGDAVLFDASAVHSVENTSGEEALIYVVLTHAGGNGTA
jgi:transcriptional regulator with XRE-family HTH domain